ncbi:MAG: M20/M25/M40 family metallo-hydrolase [Clostridiales bacterium]|nr:M20/M25/M40 family metallo-hydrolase [Clostridiales bacterium]
MVEEFLHLTSIDSLTRNERQMADALRAILEGMGLEVYEDDAGEKIGGNSGNLICNVKGDKVVPAVVVMAHMDTVVPGLGKKPRIDGDYLRSDGTTILGGDDVAGIEAILEALRIIREQSLSHGDIQVVFTVAEEGGLNGAKNLDYSRIFSKYGFVLDASGPVGAVAVKAPSQNLIDIVVEGRAAHAGIAPEEGISAISIAAEAIAAMKLGRVDEETTANIGIINGGMATNIICDRVEIKAEARSRDERKLEEQTEHMRKCFEEAAVKWNGKASFISTLAYPAFDISHDSEIAGILSKAAAEAGLELRLVETGGGSDTSILNGKGIEAVCMCIGMDKVHSTQEQLLIDDLVKTAGFLTAIICAVG